MAAPDHAALAAHKWSRANKQRTERLRASGLMHPAGGAAVGVAEENGAWSALDEVEALTEPEDLRQALDATPGARRHWDAFARSARRPILKRIANVKREKTRARRV